ncbi:MAG: GNAT family N-acetyltransferase [Planctomycetota bacterium]|jgi:GNAT superfamily N-acetyltransferase
MEGLPEGVEIRRIAPHDSLEELTDLLHRGYRELAEMGFRYWSTHQSVADTRRRISGAECWVAALDRRLVGTITFRPREQARGCPWYDRPDVAIFSQFAVEPGLQRRGIGSRLLLLVERRARETGASELALDTAEGAEHLITLYKRRGYRFVQFADWEKTNYRSVILSKSL